MHTIRDEDDNLYYILSPREYIIHLIAACALWSFIFYVGMLV